MNIINECIRYEMNLDAPQDGKRVVRDERLRLQAAMHSGDKAAIEAARAEARRVLGMWKKMIF